MPQPIENISSHLFDFLKNQFDLSSVVDENGYATTTPEDMKVFTFDFISKSNTNCGCVVISLLDSSESSDSLKVYFGAEIMDAKAKDQQDWFDFLKSLRKFAKTHMLGFDVRNVNNSVISKRDIEPMFESTFGPIDGTVKTSRQPLEDTTIIIKHSDRIKNKDKAGRSRKIHRIYLSNKDGERFLLPFKSLRAARAMARHIHLGGNPYDVIGKNIVAMVDELDQLRRFNRKYGSGKPRSVETKEALLAAKERYENIRKDLKQISSSRGYTIYEPYLSDATPPQFDTNYGKLFEPLKLDDKYQDSLPFVYRAYKNYLNSKEDREFEQWASSVDSGEPALPGNETLTELDAPNPYGFTAPLTYTYNKVPNHYRTNKEISKLKNTSGKLSPLTLLNKKEDPEDDGELGIATKRKNKNKQKPI